MSIIDFLKNINVEEGLSTLARELEAGSEIIYLVRTGDFSEILKRVGCVNFMAYIMREFGKGVDERLYALKSGHLAISYLLSGRFNASHHHI